SHRFVGRAEDETRPPHDGWAGRWDPGESWELIAFFPDALRRVLRDLDFEIDPIVRTWRDRGWLDAPKKGRTTKQMRILGERADLVAIHRKAVEADDEGDADDR
ncbi:MAG: hypothetical protein M3P49_07405, partial [Actinomycetota bacterium]|nr:hypothetical protein [Actinomycetota bacterium]